MKNKKLIKDFDISSFVQSGGMIGGGGGGGTELNALTTPITYEPEKQNGLMHVVADLDSIQAGVVKYYLDGVLTATYDSLSTGQYNEIISPTTSINWQAQALTFADTQYNGNTVQPAMPVSYLNSFDLSDDGLIWLRGGRYRMGWGYNNTAYDLTTEQAYQDLDSTTFENSAQYGYRYFYSIRYMDSGNYIGTGTSGALVVRMTCDDGAYKWTAPQCGSFGQNVTFDASNEGTGIIRGLDFNSSGSKMYLNHSNSANIIYEYDLSVNWDISTASYNSVNYNTGMAASDMRSFVFSKDGIYLYTSTGAAGSSLLYRHTLTTPFDLSTASSTDNLDLSTLLSYSAYQINNAFAIGNNNTILYVGAGADVNGQERQWGLDLQTVFNGTFNTAVT